MVTKTLPICLFLQGITALVKLRVLDVAGNMLSIFPMEVHWTVKSTILWFSSEKEINDIA